MMQDGPLKTYRALCESGQIESNVSQLLALEKLQIFYDRLKRNPKNSSFSFLDLPRKILSKDIAPSLAGLYLYGGVGRGKSLLMDLFFESCPVDKKWRIHFHGFMEDIHHRMKLAKEKLGNKSSHHLIDHVAKEISQTYSLICFDEFYVADIVNAMILSKLFTALIKRKVSFVVTSNFAPKDLYPDGLQRDLFEPFIDLLYEKFELHHLDGMIDFRRQHTGKSQAIFEELLGDVSHNIVFESRQITLQKQDILIAKQAPLIAWFDCDDLAGNARGIKEFEYYATHYKLIFLQDIPDLFERGRDYTRRFMNFIDVVYDHKVKLIFSSPYDIDELQAHDDLQFEFERTKSRLFEMRDVDFAKDKLLEVKKYYESARKK